MPVTQSTSDGKSKSDAAKLGCDPDAQEKLKGEFLEAYREEGTMWKAAKTVGIHRVTAQRWRDADPSFMLALQQADEERVDRLEDQAFGLSKTDGRLTWNMLRALSRKYNVPTNHTLSGPNGSAINVGFVDVDSMKAQLIALCHQFPTIAPKVRENIQAILDAIPK